MERQIYSAITIADELLKIAKRNGKSLTPMQIVKLTYIAKGWALAILRRNLFGERIEAWKFGPVIPDLYQVTKKYGRETVPLTKIDEFAASNVDSEVQGFLDDVFKKYGHLSGSQLSALTHQTGSPWEQVYNPKEMHIEVSTALIESHYLQKLHEHQVRSSTSNE